jgi:hypothetical protein
MKSAGAKLRKAPSTFRLVAEPDLQRLAELAKVTASSPIRENFCLFIQAIMDDVWRDADNLDFRNQASQRLVTTVRHAKAFSDGLAQLPENERTDIGKFFDRMRRNDEFIGLDENHYKGFDGYLKLIWKLARVAAYLTNEALPSSPSCAIKGGPGRKLRPTPRAFPFQRLARSLFSAPKLAAHLPKPIAHNRYGADEAKHHLRYGYRGSKDYLTRRGPPGFTFRKSPLSGTWIEAIELLRDYVPTGIIPNELSATSLERIRSDLMKSQDKLRFEERLF